MADRKFLIVVDMQNDFIDGAGNGGGCRKENP